MFYRPLCTCWRLQRSQCTTRFAEALFAVDAMGPEAFADSTFGFVDMLDPSDTVPRGIYQTDEPAVPFVESTPIGTFSTPVTAATPTNAAGSVSGALIAIVVASAAAVF